MKLLEYSDIVPSGFSATRSENESPVTLWPGVSGSSHCHQLVSWWAPAQLRLKWMWSVCGLLPLYSRHPSAAWLDDQILSFQIRYMIPSRRALACLLPYLSVFSSQVRMSSAMARSPES